MWSEEPPGGEAPCAGFGAGNVDADADAAQHHAGRGQEELVLQRDTGCSKEF